MFYIPIRVECHAGYRAEESPLALHWGGRRLEVLEIVDRWYQGGIDPQTPQADYFKVRAADGETYLIKYEPATHVWYLASEGGQSSTKDQATPSVPSTSSSREPNTL
jgi:hypothetical protein